MDLTASAPKYFQPPPPPPPPPLFTSTDNVVVMQEAAALESINNSTGLMYGKSKNNPFAETFQDPLCKLNLKETAEFVKSLPMGNSSSSIECRGFLELPVPPPSQNQIQNQRRAAAAAERRMEAPPTPGRPLFSFSVAKKNFPSKWDDAEKWLISSSCNDSPAHPVKPPPPDSLKIHKQIEVFAEKSRVTQEKVLLKGLEQHNSLAKAFNVPQEVLLKDKFTDNSEPVLPSYRYSEPSKEGFLFRERASEGMKDASTAVIHEVKHRDIGTDMTPLGSSTTSRCHTPFKITSPARHNTPADRSGPLALDNSSSSKNLIDISQLQECHLAKLQLGTQYDSVASNWSSKEEEEEEISKSLRHFEMSNAARKSISDSRAAAWEEEEKTKCCLRYQREEAKIQAWVNLESAKAEAQSRKLEVKIQKMRSNLEEKLMKRMAVVHRKAEEWRATARYQHSEHVNKAGEQAKKMANQHTMQLSWHTSCGCFPCSNHLI